MSGVVSKNLGHDRTGYQYILLDFIDGFNCFCFIYLYIICLIDLIVASKKTFSPCDNNTNYDNLRSWNSSELEMEIPFKQHKI